MSLLKQDEGSQFTPSFGAGGTAWSSPVGDPIGWIKLKRSDDNSYSLWLVETVEGNPPSTSGSQKLTQSSSRVLLLPAQSSGELLLSRGLSWLWHTVPSGEQLQLVAIIESQLLGSAVHKVSWILSAVSTPSLYPDFCHSLVLNTGVTLVLTQQDIINSIYLLDTGDCLILLNQDWVCERIHQSDAFFLGSLTCWIVMDVFPTILSSLSRRSAGPSWSPCRMSALSRASSSISATASSRTRWSGPRSISKTVRTLQEEW